MWLHSRPLCSYSTSVHRNGVELTKDQNLKLKSMSCIYINSVDWDGSQALFSFFFSFGEKAYHGFPNWKKTFHSYIPQSISVNQVGCLLKSFDVHRGFTFSCHLIWLISKRPPHRLLHLSLKSIVVNSILVMFWSILLVCQIQLVYFPLD